jgi:hypothetical protein
MQLSGIQSIMNMASEALVVLLILSAVGSMVIFFKIFEADIFNKEP